MWFSLVALPPCPCSVSHVHLGLQGEEEMGKVCSSVSRNVLQDPGPDTEPLLQSQFNKFPGKGSYVTTHQKKIG